MATARVTRLDLDQRALGRILRGQELNVTRELERRGARVLAAAGSAYEQETFVGRARARVTVRSTQPRPSSDRTLVGALEAARG